MTLAEDPACNTLCRACHYKHLDYPAQLVRKQKWARECLVHWRNLLGEIIPAPAEERIGYRSKSWMRGNFHTGSLSFGMFRAVQMGGKWGQEFISWDECPLHLQAIQTMTGRLREGLLREAAAFSENDLFGVWMGNPHLVIVSRAEDEKVLAALDWSRILVPPFNRVWFHSTSQVGKKVFGASAIRQIFGPPVDSLHPIRAFRQVAGSLLQEARNRAVKSLLATNPEMILDLYCGTGDLSLLVPENVGWVGIEHSKEAVIYAQSLRRGHEAIHQAYEGAVEQRLNDSQVLGRISSPYSIYINPPRPGLGNEGQSRFGKLIREKRPRSIVYLSCSASSLSRDLTFLSEEGFRVESLQPYDFFPQTEHFETLAVLASDS